MEINRKKQVKKKENQKGMNSTIHEKVAAIPHVFYDIAAINVKERIYNISIVSRPSKYSFYILDASNSK